MPEYGTGCVFTLSNGTEAMSSYRYPAAAAGNALR